MKKNYQQSRKMETQKNIWEIWRGLSCEIRIKRKIREKKTVAIQYNQKKLKKSTKHTRAHMGMFNSHSEMIQPLVISDIVGCVSVYACVYEWEQKNATHFSIHFKLIQISSVAICWIYLIFLGAKIKYEHKKCITVKLNLMQLHWMYAVPHMYGE